MVITLRSREKSYSKVSMPESPEKKVPKIALRFLPRPIAIYPLILGIVFHTPTFLFSVCLFLHDFPSTPLYFHFFFYGRGRGVDKNVVFMVVFAPNIARRQALQLVLSFPKCRSMLNFFLLYKVSPSQHIPVQSFALVETSKKNQFGWRWQSI